MILIKTKEKETEREGTIGRKRKKKRDIPSFKKTSFLSGRRRLLSVLRSIALGRVALRRIACWRITLLCRVPWWGIRVLCWISC